MSPNITVTEATYKELQDLQETWEYPHIEALIKDMIITMRKSRFMEVSRKFRKRMDELGLKPEDLWENCD